MPKVIKRICSMVIAPVIAVGLIYDKEDVMAALSAVLVSISSTNQDVWLCKMIQKTPQNINSLKCPLSSGQ